MDYSFIELTEDINIMENIIFVFYLHTMSLQHFYYNGRVSFNIQLCKNNHLNQAYLYQQ